MASVCEITGTSLDIAGDVWPNATLVAERVGNYSVAGASGEVSIAAPYNIATDASGVFGTYDGGTFTAGFALVQGYNYLVTPYTAGGHPLRPFNLAVADGTASATISTLLVAEPIPSISVAIAAQAAAAASAEDAAASETAAAASETAAAASETAAAASETAAAASETAAAASETAAAASAVAAAAAASEVTKTSPNLYNSEDPDAADGFRIISSNGALLVDATSSVTGYIPVTAGNDYTFATRKESAWYDSGKVFISGVASSSARVLTAPAGAAYLRTGFDITGEFSSANFWIVEGSVALGQYQPFGAIIDEARVFDLTTVSVADGAITPEKTTFTQQGKNLWDTSAVLDGYYMPATGNLVASATYAVSDYIAVEAGATYSIRVPPLSTGARFLAAFDAGKGVVAAEGVNTALNSYTVPAGIAFIRVTTWAYAVDGFQVEKSAAPTLYEPYRTELDMPVRAESLVGDVLDPRLNAARLKQTRMRLYRLGRGFDDQINIAAIGDSYTQLSARWTEQAARDLMAQYGDGGGGWTGYGFAVAASPPYTISPNNQPGLINGNVRDRDYTLAYQGSWTCVYAGTVSPDMASITSTTAGDMIQRTVPETPDHTALRVVYLGTTDGVVRYRIDGGAWSSNVNVQGTVGAIGSFDIALTGGAHTVEIEVVSGTVTLCGDNALSDAIGVRFHKLGSSGSWINRWASVDQTQQVAGWSLLGIQSATIMDGTNSQGQNDSVADWSVDMQTVIDRLRLVGSNPDITIAMPPENLRTNNNIPMREYTRAGRALAASNYAAFLDLQPYFGDNPTDYGSAAAFPLFSADNVHPDAVSGGRIMTAAWVDMMQMPGLPATPVFDRVTTLPVVVSELPAAGFPGRRAFVTNASATTFASIVSGGGANAVPVYDDGTNWRIG